jgi:hypothetical protein
MQELLNDAAKAGNLPEILRVADGHALSTLVPNLGFVRAIIRHHAGLFTPAVVALLPGGTGGGRYASTDRVCQHSPQPLLVGISGVLKNEPSAAAPRDPQPTRWTGVGCCEYPMRGVSADRGSPPPQCPAVRRAGNTALMHAALYDHPAIVEQLVVARADVNAKNSRDGCALPRSPSGDVIGRRLCRLRLRRPAGTRRCTVRQSTATPNPPCRCSSAAPTRPSRTTPGNAVLPRATPTGPHTESARIGAGTRLANSHKITTRSPRTTRRWRRCGRRHRPRAPPSAGAPCKRCHDTHAALHRPRSSAYADTPAA